ncbi:NUDIX hydrolase domain-like protein [Hyaloscypha finlandica]|nr:NUDIX hydrolase domain-like protein [Hyaloscypha finlandica]
MASEQEPRKPRIDKITILSPRESKWIEFLKVDRTGQNGKQRVWETVARKTRGTAGVDAVAIITLLKHPSRSVSTIIILQYRSPVDAIYAEFPAGLIGGSETPKFATEKELKEEAGYVGKVVSMSPVIVSNSGMSTGNMQLATVEAQLKEGDEVSKQHLDRGEFIQLVIVPLEVLYDELEQFSKESKKVDSRLWHTAAGARLASQLG